MIHDFLNYDGEAESNCDICIAGAGAAGITLAVALANSAHKVILLEGGGLEPDADNQALYQGQNLGRPSYDLDVGRVRVFGGSTAHWGGQCIPLDWRDFEVKGWVPDSGWPIARPDLDPYYETANEMLDLGRFEYDPRKIVPETPGLLSLRPELLDHRVFRFSAPPTLMGEKYRATLEQAPNLDLWINANVTGIELAGPEQPVAGLVVRTIDGRTTTVRARMYVLALGGIENPRLLLNADEAMPVGVGNQHDLVGRYFMEHPALQLGRAVLIDEHWPHAYRQHFDANEDAELRFWVALADEALADQQLVNGAAMFGQVPYVRNRSKGYHSLHDLKQWALTGEMPDDLVGDLWNIFADLDGVTRGIFERVDPTNYIAALIEQAPNPNSRVLLAPERDRLGLRKVAVDWRLLPVDKRTARALGETIARELGRLDVARVQLHEWLLAGDEVWDSRLSGSNHHMGTTRMADDPRRGVVDPNCRVFGCDNLYVAGSSVFPTGGFANPTLTIVALARRLADHLKERLAPVVSLRTPVTEPVTAQP